MEIKQKLGKAQAHLYSVWQSLRTDGNLPRKADITIRALKYFTPYYSIVHLNEAGKPAVLRSGTGLDELWGRNISGQAIADISPRQTRGHFTSFVGHMLAHPCGGLSKDTFTAEKGDIFVRELLLLPVQTKTGSTVLAVMADVKGLSTLGWAGEKATATRASKETHRTEFWDVGFGVPGTGTKKSLGNVSVAW
ncbi:MAG: PAS domain-containing protein [Kordiimonadaceae bacterium]|nr:PAS domain-containing protein [Kordiimonadaceae bacterium]